MNSRQAKPAPTGYQSRNTLGSTQTPTFTFRAPYPPSNQPSKAEEPHSTQRIPAHFTGFRAPSLTESEKEDTETFKNTLPEHHQGYSGVQEPSSAGRYSEHLSRLGDSSSLFETPGSSDFTFRSPLPAAEMVVEREPPKTSLSPRKADEQPPLRPLSQYQQPEFGKASPLQNRLTSNHVFNIPKPQKAHPEFHRPAQPIFQHPNIHGQPFERTVEPQVRPSHTTLPTSKPKYGLSSNGDVVEIARPADFPPQPTYPKPAPVVSSRGTSGFTAVNAGTVVDLTTEPALFDDRFGAADPYNYIDAGQATDNIKALLEGAFEDAEDKPRTRGRKKKVEAAVEKLTDKLQTLGVKAEEEKQEEAELEEEEEEDDGTVEGLKVKLLPHQVDGVEWMRDKETSQKKTKGVLPKGGILADDVGSSLMGDMSFIDVP
ncbi:MAG: hypothetical protein Q9195_005695 [Heterodermia aff. obscurata]